MSISMSMSICISKSMSIFKCEESSRTVASLGQLGKTYRDCCRQSEKSSARSAAGLLGVVTVHVLVILVVLRDRLLPANEGC